jgi:hypothetical protein
MTNEELYESYGFKAHRNGFFPEWRMETSSIIETNADISRADAAHKAYERIHQMRILGHS